jgi:fimbrial isopeptide formation D2 family protein
MFIFNSVGSSFKRGQFVRNSTQMVLVFAVLISLVASVMEVRPVLADKAGVCGTPGKDGPITTLSGVVNSYYPGNANVAAGATSIPVAAARTGGGTAIGAGDLLLVIQMQGADINGENYERYGDGVGNAITGPTVVYSAANAYAGGNLAANFSAGYYEYVVATGPSAGGFVPVSSGLVNNYYYSNFSTQGQRRFQVIRVPQYSNATLNGAVIALRWDGSTGGVVALDVAGELNWNASSINVNGMGFRGGGGRQLTAGTGANTDYRTLSTNNANGSKGEGYAGTPRYVNNNGILLDNGAANEGFLNGSYGRGAAGNGGGGSTDGNPTVNDQNSGGGGGGNGGYGGMGGNAWFSGVVSGGFGGAPFPGLAPRLILGGGGGAGTTNNGTPTGTNGFASSGAAGGGVVFVRAGTITGTGTINANGAGALNTVENDGGGGGGAGGSVVVIAKNGSGSVGTLTVNTAGGNGGNTVVSGGHTQHGPGGGGGGGFVYTSGSLTASNVLGGNPGTSYGTNATNNYGATGGYQGVLVTNIIPDDIPPSISGANCLPVSLATTKSTSTPNILAGDTATYTITVSNPAGAGGGSGVTISDDLPAGFTYASTDLVTLSGNAVRTSTSNPTGGDTSLIWGTFLIPAGGSVAITFTVDVNSATLPNTYHNPATATYLDPLRTTTTDSLTSSYDYLNDPSEDVTVTAGPVCGVVAQWNFDTDSSGVAIPIGANVAPAYSFKAGNVTTAAASVGTGLTNAQISTGGNPGQRWDAAGFRTSPTLTLTYNDYFQFAITTTNYTGVNFGFDARRSGGGSTGPSSMALYSSADGTNFTFRSTYTLTTTYQTFTFDMTGLTNTNGATTFRLYGYNAGSTSGTGRLDNINFTGCKMMNFGHLPSSYVGMNLLADGGANHLSGTTMFGSSLTSATDGINTITYTPKATDDGITFTPSVNWAVGANGGSVDITVTCPGAPTNPCYMNAWVDWNKDGDFNDTGEQIFTNYSFTASGGPVTLTFNIPSGTVFDGSTFYSRFRIYDQLPANPQPNGQANNGTTPLYGEIEDPFFTISSGGVETPVTLSYFLAERAGSRVEFVWSTATETGNVGFNLYVEENGELTLLNPQMIPSHTIDSLERQDYTFAANVAGNTFYIEDVDIFGGTRRHGPFGLGEAYGAQVEADRIDWSAIRAEDAVALQPDLSAAIGNLTGINMKVRQSGLYRVTYETLKTAGLDLTGVLPTRIQLTNRGQAVPIYVKSGLQFGPGAYIEFHGQALDTLYTDTNIYMLQVSQTISSLIPLVNVPPARAVTPLGTYAETLNLERQRAYANYAPGADPWYDTSMLAYKTSKSWDFPFQVDGLANSSSTAALELVVWGVTDWPQNPDHHLIVSLNGVPVADQTFNGLTEQKITISLPAGALQAGANTLRLTLPGDTGVDWDLINLDKFSVTYPRLLQARDGRLNFTAAGSAFNVTNLPSRNVVIYRFNTKGAARLAGVKIAASGGTFTATFAGTAQPSMYLVTTAETMYAPVLEAPRLLADLNRPAQYLIIAHPNFIGGLGPLVQARQAQGLTVNVVDVNDLYAQYAYGIFDPRAIQQYIAYAAQNLGTQYVLLVGGDTYDYRNYRGLNSVSFIPSLYVSTGPTVKLVPSDPLYADVNKDNIPDLAIGRFPVRTSAELDLIVNKTLAYAAKDYGATSLFAADKNDGSVSFKNISADMAADLPLDWVNENIYLDDVGVSAAKSQLLAAMNRGTALVTFTGHSGPMTWTFSSLFNTQDAAALTNAGRPFVVVQWGCWNTYYVDPSNNYLVHKFLFSGDRGAAAVLGASTLTDSSSEALLGQLLMPRMVTPGMSMGQALRDAKLELALTHPELLDVLLGWSLMGDPALVIQP